MSMTETRRRTQVLKADNWGWRYAGRQEWAIQNLSFEVAPGSRMLLLGPSGAGKSTVLAGIAGLLSPEDGEHTGTIALGDAATTETATRGKVALVQQDPDAQIVMEKVGDEVAFGLENLGVSPSEIWERVQGALDLVGLELPLDHPTEQLSGGEKQRLALACALAMEPDVLLLDEPTANLDPDGARQVRRSVERIVSATGATLVIIEHRVGMWADLADRMMVVGPKGVIADGDPGALLDEEKDRLLEAGIWVPGVELPVTLLPGTRTGTALEAANLTIGYQEDRPIAAGLNLDIGAGIGTCLLGENGAGKTTLALTLAGLLAPVQGSVEASGKTQMVFQEPSYQFLCHTVREELEFSLKHAPISAEEKGRLVDQYLELMGLVALSSAHPQSLSGGEKRRLSVATALIAAPDILILDEPTFGQDRGTWITLVRLLQEAVAGGTTVLVVTHDQELVEVLGQEVITLQRQDSLRAKVSPAPAPAPLDRTNPLVRLVALVIMTVPLFVTVDPLSAAVALGLELLLLPLAGWTPRKILLRTWPLLVAAPLAGLSMLLYGRPGGVEYWAWGPAVITENSVQLALAITLRVLALGLPAVVLLSSTTPTAMSDALTQLGHFPARPVLATLAGVRLVSLMLSDWQALQRARISRGSDHQPKLRQFFTDAFALLTFALRRAGVLSLTMEARGFGAPVKRSWARKSATGKADAALLLAAVAVPAIALSAAVAAGTFRWFGL